MKVVGISFTCLAILLVLLAIIVGSDARNDPEGAPPAPGIMMNEPEKPDSPKRTDDVPDQPKFRVRREMRTEDVPDQKKIRVRRQIPEMPRPEDMPMPGGK